MENHSKQSSEKYLIKAKLKEFIEETKGIFEQKTKQINSLMQSMRIEHNRLLSNILTFCDQNNITMDLSHSSSLTNMSFNQLKKIEKNDSIQKYSKNFQKSNEILRDTTRNSYFNKYIEECNRAKLNTNKKTASFRQNKLKSEKDVNPYNQSNNLSLVYQKKNKNLSMDKNILMMSNNMENSYSSTYLDKKKAKRITADKFNNNENANIKNLNNNNSTISDNDNTSNNLSLRAKEKSKKLAEKNDNANNKNAFPKNIPQIKNLSFLQFWML